MYLLTWNPAFLRLKESASAIPYSWANCSFSFPFLIPKSIAFAAALFPITHHILFIKPITIALQGCYSQKQLLKRLFRKISKTKTRTIYISCSFSSRNSFQKLDQIFLMFLKNECFQKRFFSKEWKQKTKNKKQKEAQFGPLLFLYFFIFVNFFHHWIKILYFFQLILIRVILKCKLFSQIRKKTT